MAELKTQIANIPEDTWDNIKRKSAMYLPNSPTASGFKPADIRNMLHTLVTDTQNSSLAEIDRVIGDINDAFATVEDDKNKSIEALKSVIFSILAAKHDIDEIYKVETRDIKSYDTTFKIVSTPTECYLGRSGLVFSFNSETKEFSLIGSDIETDASTVLNIPAYIWLESEKALFPVTYIDKYALNEDLGNPCEISYIKHLIIPSTVTEITGYAIWCNMIQEITLKGNTTFGKSYKFNTSVEGCRINVPQEFFAEYETFFSTSQCKITVEGYYTCSYNASVSQTNASDIDALIARLNEMNITVGEKVNEGREFTISYGLDEETLGPKSITLIAPKGDKGDPGEKGDKGEKGEVGNLTIAKTYESIAAMNEGFATDGVEKGHFVVISTGNVEDEDNAKLYVKGDTEYEYITDLSGAQGIRGPGIERVTYSNKTSEGYVYTMYFSDGNTSTFTAPCGPQGNPGTDGSVIDYINFMGPDDSGGYIYMMGFSDGRTFEFIAPQGPKGDPGYTLTEADKTDIVDRILNTLPVAEEVSV